jgi:hypothetical protein
MPAQFGGLDAENRQRDAMDNLDHCGIAFASTCGRACGTAWESTDESSWEESGLRGN